MIHVGTSVRQTVEIYNDATTPVLTDPSTLTVTLRAPDGTQTEYVYGVAVEVTRTSAGIFVFRSPALDQVKTWWISWEATGTGVTVADEASVDVCGLHVSVA